MDREAPGQLKHIAMVQAAVFHQSRHLVIADLYDATERCPVCLGKAERRSIVRLQDAPVVDLLECPKCRACSASFMPRPEVLQDYYANYYKSGGERNTCPNSIRFAARIAAHTSLPRTSANIRILDFGGGDGALAWKVAEHLLRKHQAAIEIDLVDYEEPSRRTTDRIRIQGYRTLEEVQGLYDLVIASAVLEHIPEVHPVLRQLFTLTRPGGYFYARTPYVVPFARMFRKLDFTFPGHVHDFGSAFWSRVAKTFKLSSRCVISGPSLVETTLASHPGRTVVAALLKAPARMEQWLSPRGREDRWWNWVGGWEIMLQSLERS